MKTDFHDRLSFLKRLFFYKPAPLIIFIIIVAGLAAYLVYSKETGRSLSEGTRYAQDNKQPRPVKHVDLSNNHAADVKNEKQEVMHEKPAEKKNQVMLTLRWDGDVKGKELPDIQDSDGQEEEALEKIRRPFSAHTMTEEEKRFKKQALETEAVTNVVVHDTGVVFFWADPKEAGDPQRRKEIMEDLAYLYRDNCHHEKPVTVVFFISGRPVQAHQFFREDSAV
ncbi:MAG: hypothetical protein DRH43_06680 [Deltaproteobacteria bacterium]|nr:MAG: hypothetical protein DRH43_06680 [Deltaproteobacteria bacterium]